MPKSLPSSSSVNRLANGNTELTITVAWVEMQKAYAKVVDAAVENSEIKGFRRGHAPRQSIESRLDRGQTFSSAVQHVLPTAYQKAVASHGLKPVVYPKIKMVTGKEGEDWVFAATLCEAPTPDHIPDMLVELQTDLRLATLAENLSRLGLTVDKYLAARKLTLEALKGKLATEARRDISQALAQQPANKP